MKSSRRHFLHTSGLFLAASALAEGGFAQDNHLESVESLDFELRQRLSLGLVASDTVPFTVNASADQPSLMAWPMVQGPTDRTSATIIIMHPRAGFGVKVLGPKNEVMPAVITESWPLPGSEFHSTEVTVTNLKPDEDYRLYLVNKEGQYFDLRRFRSLDTENKQCRFAMVSCMADVYRGETKSMWNALALQKCDFVLFVGDTCYADLHNKEKTEADYARRYSETRRLLNWFWQPRLTPSFATWDDHDFGLNNADRTFKPGKFNQGLFRKFWGSRNNKAWKKAHGVGSVFEAFGQRFFLLDDRSFRDPALTKNGRHLGAAQTEWLIAELHKSDRPAWLLNGSQFFGGYLAKESFESDHKGDFKDFLKQLAKVSAPVVFASGDVHYSEVMAIEPSLLGYKTFEFTSSSMHSFTYPGSDRSAHNPRRLASEWRHNFLVIESDVKDEWTIDVECIRDFAKPSFSGRYIVGE